jgi:hypothetical protein
LLTMTLQPIRQGRGIKVSASWLFCYHSPLKCFRLQLNWRNSAKVRGSRCSMILAGSNLDSMQNFNLNVIRWADLGEWAIALHGMVLVPSGYWFQFIEI